MGNDHSWKIQRTLHGIASLHADLLNAGADISTIRIGTEARDKIAIWTGDDKYETHQRIRAVFAKHNITETDPPGPSDESYLTGGAWHQWGLDVEIDARMGPTVKPQCHMVARLFVGGLHYLGVHPVSVTCATIRRPGDGVSERVLITVPSAPDTRVLDPGIAGRLTEITGTRRGMNGIDWITDERVLVSVIRAMPTGNQG